MDKWQLFLKKVRASHLLVGMVLVSFLGGCAGTNLAQQNPYMLTGAGLGAATGAALGIAASPGNPWKGAAIGGLLGTAVAAPFQGLPGKPMGARSPPLSPLVSRRRPRVIIRGRLRLRNRAIATRRPLRAIDCRREAGRTGYEDADRPNRDLDDA